MLSIAARADLAGVAPFGVAAKHQTLDDSVDICTLIEGDFFFNPLIAPEVPMVAEDLARPVMAGEASNALVRGTVNCLRSSKGGPILRRPWIHATEKSHGRYHGGIIGDVL